MAVMGVTHEMVSSVPGQQHDGAEPDRLARLSRSQNEHVVKIVHGGGFLPFLIGRLDHAWRRRPEIRRLTAEPTSDHLSGLWYDTVVFEPRLPGMLFELLGPGRIMLGSDYSFDMGEERRVRRSPHPAFP